ncbi:unnamed protein product [Miscanthus lutarioriparius]|uniref:Transcription initiation factor IIA gamma subunit N-terminal domain-containing protein n=1 Tax=Miscanthus lutarioriparius TaxID=422564 RepID=A0A811RTL3_9POAL|nr:unnamed protein product [Miscanthus lutarioriparius]
MATYSSATISSTAVDVLRLYQFHFGADGAAPYSARPAMATFELYRRSTIGMCLTETLDEMVSNGTLSPELAIQVLIQFDKSMTDALENQVKSKVNIKLYPFKA